MVFGLPKDLLTCIDVRSDQRTIVSVVNILILYCNISQSFYGQNLFGL